MSQGFDYIAMPPSTEYPALSPTSAAPEITHGSASPPQAENGQSIDQSRYSTNTNKESYLSSERNTMSSPGLESVRYMETEKEAYRPGQHDVVGDEAGRQTQEKRRVCGLPLWGFLALLGLLIVALAVGLGAGLGVGLNNNKSSSSSTASPASSSKPAPSPTKPPPTPSPKTFSTSGAFDGTGIALATESFGQESYGTVVVYFQHWTGDIRYMQLSSSGSWIGGGDQEVVATNARNGTPIAAVAYSMSGVSTWHIFYIDTNNVLQETINGNTTNIWTTGPLGGFGYKAMDDPNVGLQGCWEGYRPGGQINAVPIQGGNGQKYTNSSQTEGINLWYGSDPTTLQSVGWTYGTLTWTKKESLTGYNAHAGIGCYSWGPGTVTYLMASDLHDTVNILWKDLNQTGIATPAHPIGKWTNSSVAIPNSFPNTSLGYTDYLYAQAADYDLVGYNVSWNAESTKFVSNENFEITTDQALPGTRMTVTAVPADSGGQTLLVFNQVTGDTITEYTRDLEGGQWTQAKLPIP